MASLLPLPNIAVLSHSEWVEMGRKAFERGMRDAVDQHRPRDARSLMNLISPVGYNWSNGHRIQLRHAYGAGYRIVKMNATINARDK